ncbi:MAG: imidazoleglycerol-phosphate dehydratase [Candidatus Atribacteria bacterium]|nr:imidazoleglycerol-phosphate dehydratase [Candidatus Atribacteria bacterium]
METREATLKRSTRETEIELSLRLDGQREIALDLPMAFFPHILTSLAFHAGWDLKIKGRGDLETDAHHLVEDLGIVLGEALLEALGDKKGIQRFGHSFIPMDEALSMVAVDLGGRAFLKLDLPAIGERVGDFEINLIEEFLRSFSYGAKITLHAKIWWGYNPHHVLESLFKALGKAIGEAQKITGEVVPSTKGIL